MTFSLKNVKITIAKFAISGERKFQIWRFSKMAKKTGFEKILRKQQNKRIKEQKRIKAKGSLIKRYWEKSSNTINGLLNKGPHRSIQSSSPIEDYNKTPTYFGFGTKIDNFENPFFEKDDLLIKKVCKKFGINPDYQFEIIENSQKMLKFIISIEVGESNYHGILVEVSNKSESIETEHLALEISEMFDFVATT